MRSSRLIPILLTLLSGPVLAQGLDVPDKRPRKAPAKKGSEVAPRPVPRGDLVPDEGEGPKLALPGRALPATPGSKPAYEPSPTGAATFVLDQLEPRTNPASTLAASAVESLASLGAPGLEAARRALHADEPARMVVAARVLLRYGTLDDRRGVVQRMQSRVPAGTASLLLDELLATDPVLASPEYLVSLLDHPGSGMRKAAERTLSQRVDVSLLPLLATPLTSRRAATRQLALELVAQVDATPARHLVASRLDDPSAKVAARAASVLATTGDPEVPPELLRLAFEELPMDRRAAYAVLSLIEREELRRVAILDEEHVPPLLEALRSPQPIVAGAAAAALAGIGFRSGTDMAWLDRDVPYALVRYASGAVFHEDFSALQNPALSRLELLSGERFGRNGYLWQSWWGENADTFHARRAVLPFTPEDAPSIVARFQPDRWSDEHVLLVGPAVPAHREADEVIYLTAPDARELAAFLASQGVFDAERLPGLRGSEVGPGRRFEVGVGDARKDFEIAAAVEAPWLDAVEGEIRGIVRANRWQRWYVASVHGSQRTFWNAERAFWESEASPLERVRRLKELVFAYLASVLPRERDEGIAELADLYGEIGVPAAEDFPRFAALMEEEYLFGPRAQELTRLALTAAAASGEPPRPEGATVDPALGRELVGLLLERYGLDARAAAEEALDASGKAVVREASAGPDAFLRGLSAPALARNAGQEDVARLLVLLRDPAEEVQVAAVRACGEHRIEAAREEIFLRATTARPPIRAAALVAAARLGGEEVRSLCLLGLAEPDEGVQVAAVEGLAELRDPEAASVLASLFARGPDSLVFAPARQGLRDLGEAAWPNLLRLTRSGSLRSRREATLLLAYQGAPEAASLLLTQLTEEPENQVAARELAVLSCVDLRGEEEPVLAWWAWWDLVVHDDSLAWLRAAAERNGFAAPPPAALMGEGAPTGARFLLQLADAAPPHVGERARRELERLLAEPVPNAPPEEAERVAWAEDLELRIVERYGG